MKLALTMAKTPSNFYIKFKTALRPGVLELISYYGHYYCYYFFYFRCCASGLPLWRDGLPLFDDGYGAVVLGLAPIIYI